MPHNHNMKTVLCVEDSPSVRLLVQASLKSYELKFAGNLVTARAEISAGGFALLLLDIGLPDGNGLEMLKQLQNEGPREDETPIIILTGEKDLAAKESAFAIGVEDF